MTGSAREARSTKPHPFRFAAVSGGAPSPKAWTETARAAEALGYESLLVHDHMHQPLAPLPSLVAAAAVTNTLRVGTYVLCHDFRNPVVLAKELATVDVLVEGRLAVGLGAGWLESDYAAIGRALDPGPLRVARFQEAFTLVKRLLSEPSVSFHGDHFSVEAVECVPRPVQRPHPPLMIGAGGPRLLAFAAREADVVSITPRASAKGALEGATPESLDRKVGVVQEAAGSRFPQLLLEQVIWECLITPRPQAVVAAFGAAMGCDPEQVYDVPCLLIGSVEQVAETLLARRARWGVSLVSVPVEAMVSFGPVVERLHGQ